MPEYPKCKTCGARWEPTVELTPDTPHYGKALCGNCNAFLRWVPKPDRDKRKREAAHTELVKKYSRGYCELCLILASDLPVNETLEAHHVEEYQDGGASDRENVWIVCTACHKLIHWRRTYLAHLIPNGVLPDAKRRQDTDDDEGDDELAGLERDLP